eukprot:g9064.t1
MKTSLREKGITFDSEAAEKLYLEEEENLEKNDYDVLGRKGCNSRRGEFRSATASQAANNKKTLRETKRLSIVALALTIVGGFASGWIHHEFSIFHPENHKNNEEWVHVIEKAQANVEEAKRGGGGHPNPNAGRTSTTVLSPDEESSSAAADLFDRSGSFGDSLPSDIGEETRRHVKSVMAKIMDTTDSHALGLNLLGEGHEGTEHSTWEQSEQNTEDGEDGAKMPAPPPPPPTGNDPPNPVVVYHASVQEEALHELDANEEDENFEVFHWHAAVWQYLHTHTYLLGLFEIGPHNAEFIGLILALLHSMFQAVFLLLPAAPAPLPPGRGFATSCWIAMVFTLCVDLWQWCMEPVPDFDHPGEVLHPGESAGVMGGSVGGSRGSASAEDDEWTPEQRAAAAAALSRAFGRGKGGVMGMASRPAPGSLSNAGQARPTLPLKGGSKWKRVQQAMETDELAARKKQRAEKVSDIVQHLLAAKKKQREAAKAKAGGSPGGLGASAGDGALRGGGTPRPGGITIGGGAAGELAPGGAPPQQTGDGTTSLDDGNKVEPAVDEAPDLFNPPPKNGPGGGGATGAIDWDHIRHWVRYYLLDWMWLNDYVLTACSVFLIFFCQYTMKFWLVKSLDMLNMTIVESIKMILTVLLTTVFLVPSASAANDDKAGVVSELQILASLVTIAGGALFKIAEHYEKLIQGLNEKKNAFENERDDLVDVMHQLAVVAACGHSAEKQNGKKSSFLFVANSYSRSQLEPSSEERRGSEYNE